jgi:hypothetical protein
MNMKLVALASLFFLFSCNTNDKKSSDAVKTETTTTTNDNTNSGDVDAQKKALNEQSKACIALMNSLEVDKNNAIAAGNAEAAKAFQASIDSAATENAKIGQKLMALEK